MVRPDKAGAVAELTDAFRDSTAAVLTEYRGLTVAELKELRRALAGNATYAVVKNTLTKIAAREAGIDVFESLLEGPSAIAFISGDPVEVAKGLRNFGREHPHLVVKGGVLDGKALTADEVRKLADLESREVLLAKLAGGMLAPAQQFATVLAAPVAALARVLGALEAKAAADPNAVRGDGASAVEPEAAEATTPEAEVTAPEAEATAPEAESTTEPEAESPAPEAESASDTSSADAPAEASADATASADTETDTQTDTPTDAADAPAEQ
jgi:large subunit ribosomal protein L10